MAVLWVAIDTKVTSSRVCSFGLSTGSSFSLSAHCRCHHRYHSLLPHKSSLDRVELSVQIRARRVHTIMMLCVFVPANVGVFSLRSSILDVEPIYTFRGHRCVMSFYLSRECYVFHQNWKRASEILPVCIAWGGMGLFLLLQVYRPCHKQAQRHFWIAVIIIVITLCLWISFEPLPVILRQGNFFKCLPKSKK